MVDPVLEHRAVSSLPSIPVVAEVRENSPVAVVRENTLRMVTWFDESIRRPARGRREKSPVQFTHSWKSDKDGIAGAGATIDDDSAVVCPEDDR